MVESDGGLCGSFVGADAGLVDVTVAGLVDVPVAGLVDVAVGDREVRLNNPLMRSREERGFCRLSMADETKK
jgi:hypothetical protein